MITAQTVSDLPVTCPLPVTIQLDRYPTTLTVTGFERTRPCGRTITTAIAEWSIRGGNIRPVRDIVTLMRAADFLGSQGYHNLPRNPDCAYQVPRYAQSRGDTGRIVD